MVVYIFMSFSWWTILHLRNNKAFFDYNFEIIKLRNPNLSLEEIENSEAFKVLMQQYSSKNKMIFGEAFVFISLLLFGTNWIYKKHRQEAAFNLQQQNFLHSVSHELKSPLSGIKLSLETVLRLGLEGDKKERFLQMSMSEVTRLNTLIDNVLLSAKLDNKKLEANKTKVELLPLLNSIIDRLRQQYPGREITLKCSVSSCESDKWMLESIIINLLENALKYSPKSEPVQLNVFNSNNDSVFEIIDFGDGISEKDKKQIFSKFYRVGSEMTRSAKGTGLGLFIVSELLKALKASIKITDNSPKGSIFSIRL